MIRVLHYGMSPNLGGIETYLLNLARTIDPTRFHFDFLYTDLGQLPVFASELPDSKFYGVTPRRKSPRRNRQDLDRLFADEQFDILHFHANTASYVAPVKAAIRHEIPVICHSHSSGASRSRLTRLLHRWHRATLPWNRISRVAVSVDAGRWMFGEPASFEVIPNGIDTEEFMFQPEARDTVRASWGAAPGSLVVGQVGAFLPAKNHTFTLEVFAQVQRHRTDAILVLVGDGPERPAIRRRVDALGLTQSVRFLGRRTDVAAVMAGMDLLVMPSLHEGFGLVALEAQASGLPCLLSDAIPPEVVVSSTCRQLPLAAPAQAWAEQLVASAGVDRALGLETVRASGYSVEANAAAIASIYRRLVNSSGCR